MPMEFCGEGDAPAELYLAAMVHPKCDGCHVRCLKRSAGALLWAD